MSVNLELETLRSVLRPGVVIPGTAEGIAYLEHTLESQLYTTVVISTPKIGGCLIRVGGRRYIWQEDSVMPYDRSTTQADIERKWNDLKTTWEAENNVSVFPAWARKLFRME